MSKELGKHDFSGNYMNGIAGYAGMQTASVGCFQWLQAAKGRLKRGKVKVRVSGPVHLGEEVCAKARAICDRLDAGMYTGPKNVKVTA